MSRLVVLPASSLAARAATPRFESGFCDGFVRDWRGRVRAKESSVASAWMEDWERGIGFGFDFGRGTP